ncbi:MAG: pentapeptide repeat-containing protein [Propionibacteriaceae bacterium]|nr:pentapeptide repeat-containing protein [Propionibacteriaceae bacterium]
MDATVMDRIDDYLDGIFGPYDQSPSVAELRIEVRHNLLDRLGDLLEQGVDEEVAYAQVITMVGDIETTIAEFAEKDRIYDESSPEDQETPISPIGGFVSQEATTHSPETRPDEPQGSPEQIPSGDSPGETYTGASAKHRRTSPPSWADDMADAMADGIDSVISHVSNALTKAEEALSDTGFVGLFIGGDTLRDRKADWKNRWAGKRGKTFAASEHRRADFSNQDLKDANFIGASLVDTDFSGSDLSGSSFRASDARRVKFNRSNLSGSTLSSCSMRNSQFHHTLMPEAVLSYSDMRKTEFIGATMTGVRVRFGDLRGARFSDCHMDGADFSGTDLRRASFDGLMLRDINFTFANLAEATFRGATLVNVNFRHVSRKAMATMVFQDTSMDRATYASLRVVRDNISGITILDD